jgi:hypothetical protein
MGKYAVHGPELRFPRLCSAMKWSREADVEQGNPHPPFSQFRAAPNMEIRISLRNLTFPEFCPKRRYEKKTG